MPQYMYVLPKPIGEESAVDKLRRHQKLGEKGLDVTTIRKDAEAKFGPGGDLWMKLDPPSRTVRAWNEGASTDVPAGGRMALAIHPDEDPYK